MKRDKSVTGMLLALLLAVSFAPLSASAEEPAAADTANEEVVIKDPVCVQSEVPGQ